MDFLLSLISIAVAFILFYADINKKLKYLMERDSGILTYEQAVALMEFYLTFIQTDLHAKVEEFFMQQKFVQNVEAENKTILYRFIYKDINDTINNARNRVASFRIVKGQSYKTFLEMISPIDDGPIQQARSKIEEVIEGFIMNISEESIEQLKSNFLLVIEEAERLARKNIQNGLQKRYGKM